MVRRAPLAPDLTFTANDLSIVIPTRHRWDTLGLTLEALAAQTVQGFETLVVADGLDQKVPSLSGVRVVQQAHGGPGAARNHGVSDTERPLLLFIGDDMIPRPDFVRMHLERHQREPADELAVLGRIRWHPDVPRNSLHRWLDWSGALFDYRVLERQGNEEAGWTRFYSSNVSLKRALFTAAGGYDEDFLFDYEDLDFGYRLGRRGMRLVYEPRAAVEHLHPYDWDAVRRRYASRAAAEHLMATKHDWFEPWFRGQLERAASEPRAWWPWTVVVDRVPARPMRLRHAVERRANRHYLQQLAPVFRAEWDRAAQRAVSSAGSSPGGPK